MHLHRKNRAKFNSLLALLYYSKNTELNGMNEMYHGLCQALMNADADSDYLKVINYYASSSYADLACKLNNNCNVFDWHLIASCLSLHL